MKEFAKSDKVAIRIEPSEFGTEPSISLREFVAYSGDAELKPTKKGFLVPAARWDEFVQFVNAFKVKSAGKKPAAAKKAKQIPFDSLEGVRYFPAVAKIASLGDSYVKRLDRVNKEARAAYDSGEMLTEAQVEAQMKQLCADETILVKVLLADGAVTRARMVKVIKTGRKFVFGPL